MQVRYRTRSWGTGFSHLVSSPHESLRDARVALKAAFDDPGVTEVTITRLSDGKIIQQTKRPGTGRKGRKSNANA